MFKSKPLMMLIAGLALAVVLWTIVQLLQKNIESTGNSQTSAGQEKLLGASTSTKTLPNKQANAPASILSAGQNGNDIFLNGTGVPNSGISLLNEGKEITRAKIDIDGNWALSFSHGINSKPIAIDVLTVTPDGHQILSDQSLFVVNYQHAQDAQSTDVNRALLLLTAPGAHSRVLQTPYTGLPMKDGFALETIDYDNSGGVIFSGSSERAGRVLIYAGQNLVGESRVDNKGRWSLIFGNIMPLGEYVISAELVVAGENSVNLTLPFERMQPLFEVEGSSRIVIEHLEDRIQIGRALFGGGYQYSVIYAPSALEE